MGVAKHLQSGAVLLSPEASDKWELLHRMVEALIACGALPEELRSSARTALEVRERSVSTGMEQGIAVPHAAVEGIERMLVAMAILPEGIDFEALDGEPTHVVVLLLVPRKDKLMHLQTLSEVARRLGDADFRARLLAAEDPETVVRLWR